MAKILDILAINLPPIKVPTSLSLEQLRKETVKFAQEVKSVKQTVCRPSQIQIAKPEECVVLINPAIQASTAQLVQIQCSDAQMVIMQPIRVNQSVTSAQLVNTARCKHCLAVSRHKTAQKDSIA
jgi:hypothetical protein